MIETMRYYGLRLVVGVLGLLRRGVEWDGRLLGLTQRGWMQPVLRWSCRIKAVAVHRYAAQHCPAYRDFLAEQGVSPVTRWAGFAQIPVTSKDNYVKRHSIESRCYHGQIPKAGVVIDESSGSSGQATNWVRGQGELASVQTLIQHAYREAYGGKRLIVLNCFALGAWATGMNVTRSLTEIAIIKSIGPDKQRLDNTLRQFGPGYSYLIAGYPPFLKNYADTAGVDLSAFDVHLVLGGEGMSEGLRDYLLKHFSTVRSSFGASDLEINIGVETEMTIALRRRCDADPGLCQALFGRPVPPMIFQYNPADYHIESNADGELIFTIARLANIAPKVRYNLHDEGGAMSFHDLKAALMKEGVGVGELGLMKNAMPLLYVFGRSDMTVAFYGANIYPADIEEIISHDARLVAACNSFQLRVDAVGEAMVPTLFITLERCESGAELGLSSDAMRTLFVEQLMQVNQDFRAVRTMFEPEQVVIEVSNYGAGRFSDRDIRIKSRYLGA